MAHYSRLPQFEDIEIQRSSDQGGGAIKSITISKETKPDGSIVRRKETLLSTGETLVEENVISGGPIIHAGIRFLPTTPAALFGRRGSTDILPLHRRPLSSNKSNHFSKPTTADGHGTLLCRFAVCLLVVLLVFQIFLWYVIRSGQDLDTLIGAFFENFRGQQ